MSLLKLVLGLNLGPLKEQYMLLNTEPFPLIFIYCYQELIHLLKYNPGNSSLDGLPRGPGIRMPSRLPGVTHAGVPAPRKELQM